MSDEKRLRTHAPNTSGMEGNKNAQRDAVKREAQIHIRTTSDVKKRFIEQASKRGLKLTDWLMEAAERLYSEETADSNEPHN